MRHGRILTNKPASKAAEADALRERLNAVLALSIALRPGMGPGEMLQLVADHLREVVPSAYAGIAIVGVPSDGAGRDARLFVGSGLAKSQLAAIGRHPRVSGLLEHAIQSDSPVRDDRAGWKGPLIAGHPAVSRVLAVSIPLNPPVTGVLYLADRLLVGEFDDQDAAVAAAIAAQVATAYERTTLIGQLQQMLDDAETGSRRLTASEARLRLFLEASPNAIVSVDAAGKVTHVNPAAVATFGYQRSEIVGKPVEKLLPERLAKGHRSDVARFRKAPAARPMGTGLELSGRRADGTEFPAEISLAPVSFEGRVEVFATVVDLTTRKALEHRLSQAQRLESIGQLAGGIAHDFNNILAAIGWYAELIQDDIAKGNATPDHAKAITNSVQRAAALTSQLLAFGRRQHQRPRPVNLNAVVRDLEPLLHRVIRENVELKIQLGEGLPAVLADPSQIEQVVLNLAINGRDAMPDGGTLDISTATKLIAPGSNAVEGLAPGWYVKLSVADNGIGMDAATKARLFEPFFTTKEVGKGTGLGLATVHGIVGQSGGTISVLSEPGRGATFDVMLPAETETTEQSPGPTEAPLALALPGTILVVEDDRDLLTVITEALRREGHTVLSAAGPLAALDGLPHFGRVDLILCDVIMPGMTGPKLIEKIGQPGMPVLYMSGYPRDVLDDQLLINGQLELIHKPFSAAQLRRRVNEMLGNPTRSAAPKSRSRGSRR